MRRPAFVLALLIGAAVRIAVLPVTGSDAIRATIRESADSSASQAYSPAAVYEMDTTARLARLVGAAPLTGARLAVAHKLPGLAATVALTLLLYLVTLARTRRLDLARWAALACWLNPALVLSADVLGHLDPLMILPALAALMLVHAGAPLSAGALAAVAALTDPIGVLVLPAVGVAAGSVQGWTGQLRVAGGALAAAAVLVLPSLQAGTLTGVGLAFVLLASSRALPADAASLWWIVSRIPVPPVPPAVPVRLRSLTRTDPRPWVAGLAGLAGIRAIWVLRGSRSLALHAALAAYLALAAVLLLAGGRAHHLALVVALLALAAGLKPTLRPLFYTVTATSAALLALSLDLLPQRALALPPPAAWVDLRSVLVLLIVIVFALFSGMLGDEALAERAAHYTPYEGSGN